jgi:predicted nucleic acid-binding protein
MEEIFKKFEAKKNEALGQLDNKGEGLSLERQKEILKEAINEKITETPLTSSSQQTTQQAVIKLKDEPKERQIELLIQRAFDKGVVEAVEIAKNLDSPYLLDEFHDALIDHLYNKLVEEGKLKQI